MSKNTVTTEMTASEVFEHFAGKRCNIDIEIGITAFFSLDQCFLTFEENENYIDDNGNEYEIYDDLTILQCGSESTVHLAELDEIVVEGDKTILTFENDVTLTIEVD